jgi:5-methylcytosine-specific restriction endonuclease McrA
MAEKRCSTCGLVKPLAQFHVRRDRARHRPESRCKPCELARHRAIARRRGPATRQQERAKQALRSGKTYRTSDERRAEREAKARERQRLANLRTLRAMLLRLLEQRCQREGISMRGVRYRRQWERDSLFRARERDRQRAFKHAHPDVAARWGDRRKLVAAERSDGTLTGEVVRRLFASADLCPYCAVQMENDMKVLDHLQPLARGGLHGLSNVVVCCRACNREKGSMPYAHWMERCARRAGLSPRGDTTSSPRRVLPGGSLTGNRRPQPVAV